MEYIAYIFNNSPAPVVVPSTKRRNLRWRVEGERQYVANPTGGCDSNTIIDNEVHDRSVA